MFLFLCSDNRHWVSKMISSVPNFLHNSDYELLIRIKKFYITTYMTDRSAGRRTKSRRFRRYWACQLESGRIRMPRVWSASLISFFSLVNKEHGC